MTDKKEPTVIHGAKLYFETIGGSLSPPRHLGYRARADVEAYTVHTSITIMRMQVFFIAGYDPQKLLPAPPFEREFMQSMSEWAAERIKLPYTEFANSVLRDSVIGDGFIDFKTHSDHPFVHIDLFRDYARDNSGPVDPVVFVGGDAAAHLEAARKTISMDEAFREARLSQQMVNYVYGMLIHETIGGSLSPRGKITIYDYDDGTYIDLEGEGELPGAQQCIIDFYAKPPPREHAAPPRDQSYLAHDPTKRHKRRKK